MDTLKSIWNGLVGWTQAEWSALGSFLSGAGTLIGAFAVFAAAWMGSKTFESWRRQKLSERRIDQAERILTAAYKVRSGLRIVRNPAVFHHETATAEEHLRRDGEWNKIADGETEQRRYIDAQVIYDRINGRREDRISLQECQPMARALFGENLEQASALLDRQFWNVQVAVEGRLRGDLSAERRKEIEAAIWEEYPSSEENEMDKTIAEQVRIIEEICVPVLQLDNKN